MPLANDASPGLRVIIEEVAVGLYTTTLDGHVLCSRVHDPEHDTARVLAAIGHTGNFWTIDAKTGTKRMLVNIDKAKGLQAYDHPVHGLQIRKYKPFPKGEF